jgi:GNAT superfamily N-acetyltransferase
MQEMASRLWPLGFHPGGLGWSVATDQFGPHVELFEDDGELVGFAGVDEPGALLAQADPARPDVATAIVDWFLENDQSSELRIDVVDADRTFRDAVESAGFVRLEDARPVHHMRRDVHVPTEPPPDGYTVRPVEPDEIDARIDVHRRSWDPHALPWHPDHRPDYPPDARSTHNEQTYGRVRATWLYDPALDLVAVADDGSFAGCCIVWLDPGTGTAEVEPLGVVPEHRRRGVAGAMCHEAVRRVAAAGGSEVYIFNGPNEAYPAPGGAYAKAGFRPVDRGRTYVLQR